MKRARILFDTGCGATSVHKDSVNHLKKKTTKETKWQTKAGSFKTDKKVKCTFAMPEFHENKDVSWNMCVDKSD